MIHGRGNTEEKAFTVGGHGNRKNTWEVVHRSNPPPASHKWADYPAVFATTSCSGNLHHFLVDQFSRTYTVCPNRKSAWLILPCSPFRPIRFFLLMLQLLLFLQLNFFSCSFVSGHEVVEPHFCVASRPRWRRPARLSRQESGPAVPRRRPLLLPGHGMPRPHEIRTLALYPAAGESLASRCALHDLGRIVVEGSFYCHT